MTFSLEEYTRTITKIDRYLDMFIPIISSFYDKNSCSFFRKNMKSLTYKREDLWDKYNSVKTNADKELWEEHIGKGVCEKDFKNNVINLTSSTSCYLSLKSKYNDEQLSNDNCLKFDKNKLRNIILKSPWTSTGLPDFNFYTSALLLPALKELGADKNQECIKHSINLIKNELELNAGQIKTKIDNNEAYGCISLENYPPNAFLTYWALKSLKSFDEFNSKKLINTRNWAFEELTKQAFFHNCEKYEYFDVFQLSYCFLLLKEFFNDFFKEKFSKSMINYCLEIIFFHQEEKGFWRSDKPLFHYPKAGNAYHHDFEMLVCLLENFKISDYNYLKPFSDNLAKSLNWIDDYYKGEKKIKGWSSYHHHDWKEPESWATAAILNFLHLYKLVLTKQYEDIILDNFFSDKNPYTKGKSLNDLMDSEFKYLGINVSLKDIIVNNIVKKVKENGVFGSYGIIFYGPPGSSKTTYAQAIAKELKWRYVEINPGKFIEKGLPNIEQTTKVIFDNLYLLDEVVILFDEFDELVRERSGKEKGEQSEAITRFITTSILPKLQKLKDKEKNKLFIVATNHLEKFDEAIRRIGRFDYLIPVRYPTFDEKIKYLKMKLKERGISQSLLTKLEKTYSDVPIIIKPEIIIGTKTIKQGSIKDILERLSYLEFKMVVDYFYDLLKSGDIDSNLEGFINKLYKYTDVKAITEWELNSEGINPRII